MMRIETGVGIGRKIEVEIHQVGTVICVSVVSCVVDMVVHALDVMT